MKANKYVKSDNKKTIPRQIETGQRMNKFKPRIINAARRRRGTNFTAAEICSGEIQNTRTRQSKYRNGEREVLERDGEGKYWGPRV